jgi:16S rRNA (cytosine967-C5)-methyltransferase
VGLFSGEKMTMEGLDREWIVEQSQSTGFSVPTVNTLIEICYLKPDNSTSLKQQVNLLIHALQTPQKYFSIRINPIQKDSRTVDIGNFIFKNLRENPFVILKNMLFIPVEGPFTLQTHPREIVVDKFAAESVMTGANLYIPGFIKPLPRFQKGEIFSIYGPNHIHVANGITQFSHKEILELNNGIGIKTTQSRYKIPSYRDSEFYNKGILSDHSFGPFLACNLIMEMYKPEIEQTIFDVCSAPGHKTCALSEIGYYKFGEFPKIISIDRSSKRLERLHQDISRLRLENIQIIAKRFEKVSKSHPELLNSADFLILDPPCSALGTRPKLSISHTHKDFRSFFLLQRRLLKNISQFLKKDGYLLYTTCTLTPLENEGIVGILKNKYGFELIDSSRLLSNILNQDESLQISREISYGIARDEERLEKIPFAEEQHLQDLDRYISLSKDDAQKVLRVDPMGTHTTGYFIALLRKTN